jgi:hypothetical protein
MRCLCCYRSAPSVSAVLGLSLLMMTSPAAACRIRTSNGQATDDSASDDVLLHSWQTRTYIPPSCQAKRHNRLQYQLPTA